jgi:hypothetical protein
MQDDFMAVAILLRLLALACAGACGCSGGHGGTAEEGGSAANDSGSRADVASDGLATGPETGDAAIADAGMLPAVDPNAMMAGLSDAQLGEICDWMYGELGGYGTTVPCTGSVIMIQNPADQAACIPTIRFNPAGCPLTVDQFETCVLARAPSKGCAEPDPQCTPVFYCHVETG